MKFKIVSTNLPKPLEIESEATTWGAFKKDLEAAGVSTKNIIGGVRSTKHTLDVDDAVIPHSNSIETIFIYANEMKSGAPRKGESRADYNARRRAEAAKAKNKKAPVKKAAKEPTKKAAAKTTATKSCDCGKPEMAERSDVETIIKDIHAVTTEIINLPGKLDAIEAAIRKLPMTADDSAKLQEEWSNFRAQLKSVRGWK